VRQSTSRVRSNSAVVPDGNLAESEHRPKRALRSYRIVVLRKTIVEERGQFTLRQTYRYFF